MSTSNQQQRGGRRQPFGFLHANTLSAKGSCAAVVHGGGGGAAAARSSDPIKNKPKKQFRGVLASRGGMRQPFGFLHANTLSAKGSSATTGNGGGGGVAAASHTSDPVKNKSKKQFRGVLTSIVLRSKGKKNERRPGKDVSMPVSPTRKARVSMEHDSKPNVEAGVTVAAAANEDEPTDSSGPNEIDATGIAGAFRRRPAEDASDGFWDDELEDTLDLKRSNPILGDSIDMEEDHVQKERIDPSRSLAMELDENASGEEVSWSNWLEEGKDGFKIHFDK